MPCLARLLLGLWMFMGVAHAADAPPTAAGREFAAWLEVFNAGKPDAIAAFAKEHNPAQAEAGMRWANLRAQSGGFDLEAVEESTETRIVARLQARADKRAIRLTFAVDAAVPNHISGFMLQPAGAPQGQGPAPQRLGEAEAIAALKAEIARRGDAFSGAVMIAKGATPIFATAVGEADREHHIANTPETRFRIGSMNKMFTAVAVMQLVQAGKVKLDDPLIKYLPDYPNKELARAVTIHHLLTHTGGTGDYLGSEFAAHRAEMKTLKDYVARFGARAPAFAPGSRFDYSNFGFVLLGRVIEAASGVDYYTYVREHVFTPAGMTATDSLPEDQPQPARSIGYTGPAGAQKANIETLPYRGSPAGGGYSTVGDLVRFADALMTNKLLNGENTRLMTTGKVEMGPGAKYAYGFGDVARDGVRSIGHNGGAPGQNGELMIFPVSGYVVVALGNTDPPGASAVAAFIAARLPAN